MIDKGESDMEHDGVAQKIIDTIERRRQEIIDLAEDILAHPEMGFKEERTAKVIAEKLEGLGLKVKRGLALTGVKGYLDNGGEGIKIGVIGELDAVKSPSHPKADPVTQAAHACGHHAQLAALLGAAIALTDPEVRASLEGNVIFFAVPAEEYGEIEYKNGLREKGSIEFLGGKAELIRLGEFNEIDIAVSHHAIPGGETASVVVGSGTTNGFIAKSVRYIGKETHAAASPHEGVNALNAAMIGLSALNAQRETFKDADTVRIHPIITKGGDLVNVVPGEVKIEALVRARTIEAILDANAKATRAFEAGAHAVGAEVQMTDLPGYLPRLPELMPSPIRQIAENIVGSHLVKVEESSNHSPFSSDIGDVSHILPVISFSTGGFRGAAHAPDFVAVDPEAAYILPAKIMALTVYSLLKEGAAKSREIKEAFKPKLTGQEYVKYMRSVLSPASSGQSEKSVPLRTAISDIRQACFHFADLYYHFSRVLVEELGPERGKLLIEKAVRHRAIERGEKLRERAIAMGVPLNMEGWSRVTDIPFTGWDKSFGRLTCPYAAAWLPRLDKEPWFQEIAQLYCDVNDTQVTESFTGDTSQRITKNVLCGDETCEREYFPIEKKDAGK